MTSIKDGVIYKSKVDGEAAFGLKSLTVSLYYKNKNFYLGKVAFWLDKNRNVEISASVLGERFPRYIGFTLQNLENLAKEYLQDLKYNVI